MRIQAVQRTIILTDHFSLACAFSQCSPEIFHRRVQTLRQADERFALGLDPKADYGRYDCWLDESGQSGFAVGRDHELTNVFSSGNAAGMGSAAVSFAKERYGSLHLNCYAGAVERFYLRHGFTETRRMPNWDGAELPDVVYMRYDV